MIVAIIVAVVLFGGIFALTYWIEGDECPRVIYGYTCRKGRPEGCDHSPGLVEQAKWDVRRK